MKIINNKKTIQAMYQALERSVAVYELLKAHARGETDLTEDQLVNVVTVISLEARDTLAVARGRVVEPRACAYRAVVARRTSRPLRRPRRGATSH